MFFIFLYVNSIAFQLQKGCEVNINKCYVVSLGMDREKVQKEHVDLVNYSLLYEFQHAAGLK